MRWAAFALALSACAHVPKSTDFSRAFEAAIEQRVDELLKSGTCLPQAAIECRESSVLITFGVESLYFDRDGKRVGRSWGSHMRPSHEGQIPECLTTVREVQICAQARYRVKRVGVTIAQGLAFAGHIREMKAGQRLDFGPVEATVGYGDRGPIVLALRRVPEGVSVLTGEGGPSAPMHEVYERAVVELPARVTVVNEDEWLEFTVDIERETYELNVPTELILGAGSK